MSVSGSCSEEKARSYAGFRIVWDFPEYEYGGAVYVAETPGSIKLSLMSPLPAGVLLNL